LGNIIEPLLAPILTPVEQYVTSATISIIIAFLIVTILEIVLGEIVPKIWARERAESMAMFLIRPLELFVFIFRPVIWLVTKLSNVVLRMLGLRQGDSHGTVYSVEELEMLVTSSRKAGVLDVEEEVILRRVFDFGELKARQVMLPRTEIEAIDVDATFGEVVTAVTQFKHSRFPVFEGNMDHIIGVLLVKDLFMVMAGVSATAGAGQAASKRDGRVGNANATRTAEPAVSTAQGFNVRSIMRHIEHVPETSDVAELLNRMQKSGQQIVVVIDEYGGTAGMVTMEDIVEEIVGEVRDEFETGEPTEEIVVTPTGTLVDGFASIDDVNDRLGLDIKSESDTIAGYVFDMLGRKPELGDQVTHGKFTFRVEELDGLRIAEVRITQTNSNRAAMAVTGEQEE
ncbi:MAG: hemolysin family protein, partial [Chloroflexia bacterium]